MCNVQDEGEKEPVKFDKSRCSKTCMKCKSCEAIVLVRAVDPMCRDCFQAYSTHKFRMSFGKNRLVRDGEKALVAFSGGSSSTAMLYLVQEGKSPRANKKLRFDPSILFIEEGVVLNATTEDRRAHLEIVTEKMKSFGLPFYIFSLEQSMTLGEDGDSSVGATSALDTQQPTALSALMEKLTVHEKAAQQFRDLFDSCKTLTAKENLLHILRERLMVYAAQRTGHTKILVGDSATRLGIRILSSITQGRGAHLAMQVNFGDGRHGDVTIVRPMREFIAKEVAMYNQINGLETITQANLATKVGGSASLERLTEQFVAGLQAEYPNTVPTIFRTGGKMATTDPTSSDADQICILCKAPIDTKVGRASALQATIFSQSLSNKSKEAGSIPEAASAQCESCGQSNCSSDASNNFCLTKSAVMELLCYGCRLVLKDVTDISTLPASITNEASTQARRLKMKESIEEFLLEDESGDQT